MFRTQRASLYLCFACLLIGSTNRSFAVLHTWTGLSSTNWFSTGNWSSSNFPATVPGTFDDVLIGNGVLPNSSPRITASTTVRNVTVQRYTALANGNLAIDQGRLKLNDLDIGIASAGTVVLPLSSSILESTNQITVGSNGILDNMRGAIEHLSGQPFVVNGTYNQVIGSSAQLEANDLQVRSGGNILHSKGVVDVNSLLTISGGNNARYSLQGSGTLDVPRINIGGGGGGTLLLLGSAQIPSTHTINVIESGLFDVRIDYDYSGTLALSDALSSEVRLNDGVTAKTLTMSGVGGLLRGKGTIDGNLVNAASVDPGTGFVGSFVLTNDYEQTASGDLVIDITGTALSSYDNLDVTGDITLDGSLEADLPGSFMPAQGDSFDIITFGGSRSGSFSDVTLPALTSGLSMALVYGGNAVTLTAGLDGDLTLDGFVGIDDLNVVLGNWNQNVAENDWALGDPSSDGFVGIDDLNIVLGNWNAGTPPAAVVPEPASILLVSGAMGLLLCGRGHCSGRRT